MKDNNSKQVLLSVLGVAILVVAVVGVSFAAFSYSKEGEQVNTITTGTITMSYSENTNGINLTDAIPMTDEIGKSLNDENQYFDFTVSATMGGNVIINYVITAIKEDGSTLPDNAVKVYLTNINGGNESQVLVPTKLSDLQVTSLNKEGAPDGQFVLYNGNFNKTEARNYRLRMWVASDYVLPDFSQTYKLRINVYGNVSV